MTTSSYLTSISVAWNDHAPVHSFVQHVSGSKVMFRARKFVRDSHVHQTQPFLFYFLTIKVHYADINTQCQSLLEFLYRVCKLCSRVLWGNQMSLTAYQDLEPELTILIFISSVTWYISHERYRTTRPSLKPLSKLASASCITSDNRWKRVPGTIHPPASSSHPALKY